MFVMAAQAVTVAALIYVKIQLAITFLIFNAFHVDKCIKHLTSQDLFVVRMSLFSSEASR